MPDGNYEPYQIVGFLRTGKIPLDRCPGGSDLSPESQPEKLETPIAFPSTDGDKEPNLLGRMYRKFVRADTSERTPKKK
jgi:hypothetical protein